MKKERSSSLSAAVLSKGQGAPLIHFSPLCHVELWVVYKLKTKKQCRSQVGLEVPLSLREFKPCCAANPLPLWRMAASTSSAQSFRVNKSGQIPRITADYNMFISRSTLGCKAGWSPCPATHAAVPWWSPKGLRFPGTMMSSGCSTTVCAP